MSVERLRFRRRPVSLTSLIDIIFLLLLFFMLSSTFTKFSEVPLMNAGGGAEQGARPLFLQLRPDGMSLNGEVTTLDALLGRIEQIKAGMDEQTVLITVDATVSSQRLIDVLAVLRNAPDLAVSVLE